MSALGVLGLLAVAAPAASAAWTTPFNLSAPGQGAIQPAVAAGEAAGAVFAWQLAGPPGVAQTRVRSWQGVRSATQDLSVAGGEPGVVSFEPDVAVDESGAAVYAWGRYTQTGGSEPRVQARARSAGGDLSPIRYLSPYLDGVDDIHVDVDADGDAVFVWEADMGTYHQIQARTRSAGGVRGPLLQLSPPGQDATEPQVAIDADGDAVFAWQRLDGTNHRAEGRALSAGGVLEPTTQLSSSRWTSITPQVAVNPAGDALFVWRSFDPNGLGSARIEMRGRLASGTYTRRQTVADATGDARDPQVGIADDGSGLFAWRRSTPTRQWIKLRARSALGALGQEQTVTRALSPGSLSAPRLSLDAGGDAVVAWEVANRSVSRCCLVQARTRSAAGVFGGVTTVTTAGSQSALASDADGDAALVWTRQSADGGRIQAAVGP